MNKISGLVLSAIANVALLGIVITLALRHHERAGTGTTAMPVSHSTAAAPAKRFSSESGATESDGQQITATSAQTGSSGRGDLKELIAQLRAAGWSEDKLLSIVTSDFWQQRQKEQRELWRKARRGQIDMKTMQDWNLQMQDQMKSAVDSVLGAGAYDRWERKNLLQMFQLDAQELDDATADKLYSQVKEWNKKNQNRWLQQQSSDDPEAYQRQWAAEQVEYERKLKEILGDDRYATYKMEQNSGFYGMGNQFASLRLSDVQRQAAARVMLQFKQQQTELNQLNQAGQIDPQDYQEQQRQLQAEQNRQLKDAIGADAALHYQEGNDWDFRRIRSELRKQEFTDEQIDATYRARQALNEQQQELQKQMQQGTLKGDDYQQQLQVAQDALQQNLTTALGEQGYLAYLKAQDYKYRQMTQYAPVWQLSQSDVDTVWETLHDYQQAVSDYQKQNQAAAKQGQQVDWQQVQQETANLATQTEQQLRARLGDDRFNKLQRAGIIQISQSSGRVIRHSSSTVVYPSGQMIIH